MAAEKNKDYAATKVAGSVTDDGIPDYLTVADLAAKVQLHASTIRHEIQGGKLKAIKFGSGYRIDPADVSTWLESRKVICMNDHKAIPLRRGNRTETEFGQVARQMDRAGRETPPETVRHAEAS